MKVSSHSMWFWGQISKGACPGCWGCVQWSLFNFCFACTAVPVVHQLPEGGVHSSEGVMPQGPELPHGPAHHSTAGQLLRVPVPCVRLSDVLPPGQVPVDPPLQKIQWVGIAGVFRGTASPGFEMQWNPWQKTAPFFNTLEPLGYCLSFNTLELPGYLCTKNSQTFAVTRLLLFGNSVKLVC